MAAVGEVFMWKTLILSDLIMTCDFDEQQCPNTHILINVSDYLLTYLLPMPMKCQQRHSSPLNLSLISKDPENYKPLAARGYVNLHAKALVWSCSFTGLYQCFSLS